MSSNLCLKSNSEVRVIPLKTATQTKPASKDNEFIRDLFQNYISAHMHLFLTKLELMQNDEVKIYVHVHVLVLKAYMSKYTDFVDGQYHI